MGWVQQHTHWACRGIGPDGLALLYLLTPQWSFGILGGLVPGPLRKLKFIYDGLEDCIPSALCTRRSSISKVLFWTRGGLNPGMRNPQI